jgi:hypothetical protein
VSRVPAVERSLAWLLVRAAAGAFPPADGSVLVVPPYRVGTEAVVGLPGFAVVATEVPEVAVKAADADGFGGATGLPVLCLLAGPVGAVDTLDVLLAGSGTGRSRLPERSDLVGHPRVTHARAWRDSVQVHGDERGLVILARGVGGLPELGYAVAPAAHGTDAARELLREGLGLVPAGEPVLLAIAPAEAASLRCALTAEFTPIGSVQLVRPGRRRPRPEWPWAPGWSRTRC